ncbi:MAG TPA: hypothetical protein VGA69_01520 [Nitriliruptorales bacterium]
MTRVAWVAGAAWFLLAAGLIVWLFGSPDRTALQAPDEVATARGALLVADHGTPTDPVAFDDPTGLARMRMWVQAGDQHVASVPATAQYVYGLPRAVPGGAWVAFVLPALGVGALAAGACTVLDRSRWLGALVPGLAFPALYWMLRPWHNVSLELALTGLVVAAFAVFARARRRAWALAGIALATGAALVRPDHVHLLLGLPLVWSVALDPGRWRRWVGWHAGATVVWVLGVVVGNLATTGQPLVTPVDLLDFPSAVTPVGRDLPFPLPQLLLVLAPRGWPDWSLVADQLGRYWLGLWPAVGVVLSGLVASAWFAVRAWRQRRPLDLAVTASVLALVWHAISRVSATDLGATAPHGALVHSYPRYTALVYVGFALVAVAAAAGIADRRWRGAAGVTLAAFALLGVQSMFPAPIQEDGLVALRSVLREADAYAAAVAAQLPPDAIVYSRRVDKYVWGSHPVGTFQDERVPEGVGPVAFDRLPRSFRAAIDAGFAPYLLELTPDLVGPMRDALEPLGLRLEATGIELPEVTGIPDPPVYRVVEG